MPRRALLFASALLALACGHEPPTGRSEPLQRGEAIAPTDGLPPASRAALEAAPVPMLLLPAEHAAGSLVTSGEHWAALSYRDDALTISIHATDVSHPVVADDELLQLPPPESSVRGEPARVTMNEQIQSVTWSEGGPSGSAVSYVLEVECARPFDDTRCTESDFVLELAERLVPANNVPARRAASPQPGEVSR